MKNPTQMFISLSPEIEELLFDNQVDLVELLQQEGMDVRQEFAKDPTADANSGYKDATRVIWASAALVLSITPLLSNSISALSHKTVLVKEKVLVPVEDSSGNVVRDSFGEPMLHWLERSRFLESSEEMPSSSKISLKGPLRLEITYEDSPVEALTNKNSLKE